MMNNYISQYVLDMLRNFLIALIILIVSCVIMMLFITNGEEPIKQRKQIVIIKSVGVEHVYEVDGERVKIEYTE